jgi:hypothetical protein
MADRVYITISSKPMASFEPDTLVLVGMAEAPVTPETFRILAERVVEQWIDGSEWLRRP